MDPNTIIIAASGALISGLFAVVAMLVLRTLKGVDAALTTMSVEVARHEERLNRHGQSIVKLEASADYNNAEIDRLRQWRETGS